MTNPRRKGGRPKSAPGDVRRVIIGVRVSQTERAAISARAGVMGITPAQWLREAALSRRLPSPPVAAINREEYASLARLSANLNQLARAANEGRPVQVDGDLLRHVGDEVSRLRLALIGAVEESQ